MKALSIVCPGGSHIAAGRKTLEVRRWAPDLSPLEDLLIVENRRFLHVDGDEDLNGVAVALVKVCRVRPFVREDVAPACASRFEAGWLAWELADVRKIEPITGIVAARHIYDVDLDPERIARM